MTPVHKPKRCFNKETPNKAILLCTDLAELRSSSFAASEGLLTLDALMTALYWQKAWNATELQGYQLSDWLKPNHSEWWNEALTWRWEIWQTVGNRRNTFHWTGCFDHSKMVIHLTRDCCFISRQVVTGTPCQRVDSFPHPQMTGICMPQTLKICEMRSWES